MEPDDWAQETEVRGANLVELVIDSPAWVHRRIDTLTLSKDGETHRSVSLDVTPPEALRVNGSSKQVLVPLALIRKGTLRRVSTSGPSKHPFPLLEKARNSTLAREMLLAMIPQKWVDENADEVVEAIAEVVESDGSEGGAPTRRLLSSFGGVDDFEQAQTIEDLAATLESHFLLIAVLDDDSLGKRCVVKISYEHELEIPPGWDYSIPFRYDLPDYGFAASEHVEVVVPTQLALRVVSLEETGGSEPTPRNEDFPGTERARGHVSLTPTDRFAAASVFVEVAPSKRGILPFTSMSVAVVVILVGLAILERFDVISALDRSKSLPSTAVSLLLAGPALFLSWIARTPEHELVAKLLGPLRMCLLLCAGVFLGLGGVAAFPLTSNAWDVAWLAVYGGTAVALVWFLAFRLAIHRRFSKAVDWLSRKRAAKDKGEARDA